MKMYSKILILFLCNLCLLVTVVTGSIDHERKPYIVYMGELPNDRTSVVDHHDNLLLEAIGNEEIARESKIHSYGRSFSGFVARLLPHEAETLSQKENVVSVFPNTIRKLRTTRSWEFLGMPSTVKRDREVESNTIVGLLDTGIYIQSKSFSDEGFGTPPSKWKGKCERAANFTGCNNKVIGAQYFNLEGGSPGENTPADFDGHGTHTSSTAGGVPVEGANFYGIANGTARGGVPLARIAMYKVCYTLGCPDMDILAGFDAAIADGVDILSLSIGGPAYTYFNDVMAIGAFHAMKKGILVSCAAGNDGPYRTTVENVAPWITTVAASLIDRALDAPIVLGNGEEFFGNALNLFALEKDMYPLISGTRARNASAPSYLDASTCDSGSLDPKKVKGKIVYCQSNGVDGVIQDLGGVATIMINDDNWDTPFMVDTPATYVTSKDGIKIDRYINSTENPTGVIKKTRALKTNNAPIVATFSSRGPQYICLTILKPDISAPGDAILAAYSELTSVSGDPDDKRRVKYFFESGTSMATPHVSAAAAYVKTFHPDWSPAAIKSALMTTAKPMKYKQDGGEMLSGAGNVGPVSAVDPGLVYDIDVKGYISFLCKEGYNGTEIGLLTGNKKENCSKYPTAKGHDGLNYPTMHIQLNNSNDTKISTVFYRTVTYVGEGKSEFKAKIESPKGLSVKVVPNVLSFSKPGQKRSYKVTVKGEFVDKNAWYLSAALVWSDPKHNVKCPLNIYRYIPDS